MNNTKTVAVIGVVVLVAIVAAVGLGSKKNMSSTSSSSQPSSSSSSSSNSNAVATDTATLKDYAFTPAAIKVKVGTTVTWTNQDAVGHSVLASTTSSDAPNGPLLSQGQSYKFTFNKAGTYTLHCGPHPYMHEIVQVTN